MTRSTATPCWWKNRKALNRKRRKGAALFVGQDLRIGQAGMVVDGQVKVFPPDPPAPVLACALAGDPMSGALVAPHWLSRLQRRDAVEAKSTQHATDGGGRDDELARDLLAGQALTPERFDPLHRSGRRRLLLVSGKSTDAAPRVNVVIQRTLWRLRFEGRLRRRPIFRVLRLPWKDPHKRRRRSQI
jgi:hypothetical protein